MLFDIVLPSLFQLPEFFGEARQEILKMEEVCSGKKSADKFGIELLHSRGWIKMTQQIA
jgi:hypothetical protein